MFTWSGSFWWRFLHQSAAQLVEIISEGSISFYSSAFERTCFQSYMKKINICHIQINDYETDLYFHQNFQSNTTVCFIIQVFWKSCKLEIVLAVLQIKTKTISCSQALQNAWVIKKTVVLLWKIWRKYGHVSYLFSSKKHDRKISWNCWCIKIRMLFHNLIQPMFDGVAWCWPRDKSEKMTCLECLRN